MKSRLILATVCAVCAVCTPSPAQDTAESTTIEDLQRQVRALEARVQALTAATNEVAELTMRSAAIWTRALAGEAKDVRLPTKPPAKSKPPAARQVTRAPEELGTVRGKVTIPSGEPIAYAYVENVFAPPVRGKTIAIDQRDKTFVPGWAVVRRGTTIEFPNHDNIYHNVFSHSSGNSFDLGLYNSGSAAKSHVFQAPGAAEIYCNIHPNMAASVLVVPNDLFAKVQPDGSFVIRNVPSGQRKVVAWSPSTSLAAQWVELKVGSSADVALTLVPKSRVHKNKAGRAYGSYE
jgi:plastocyanin